MDKLTSSSPITKTPPPSPIQSPRRLEQSSSASLLQSNPQIFQKQGGHDSALQMESEAQQEVHNHPHIGGSQSPLIQVDESLGIPLPQLHSEPLNVPQMSGNPIVPAEQIQPIPSETWQQIGSGQVPHHEVLKMLSGQVADFSTYSTERYGNDSQFKTLSGLQPSCEELLVDPGVCSKSHLGNFARFVQQQAESGNPFANAWEARQAFSESLGTEVLYRAVTVTPEVAENIHQTGFAPRLYRELENPQQQPDKREMLNAPIQRVVVNHIRPISRGTAELTELRARVYTTKNDLMKIDKASFSGKAQEIKALVNQAIEDVNTAIAANPDPTEQASLSKKYLKPLMQSAANLAKLKTPVDKLDRNAISLATASENAYKALKECCVLPELRRQDTLQSLTALEDMAKSVASSEDLSGVQANNGKQTFVFKLEIPKLDAIDPGDYVDDHDSLPVGYTLQLNQGGQTQDVHMKHSRQAEVVMMGAIPPDAIKSYELVQGIPPKVTIHNNPVEFNKLMPPPPQDDV